jgi:Mrp family chromosome partitioning ATPase
MPPVRVPSPVASREVPEPPDSEPWVETTVQPVEELSAGRAASTTGPPRAEPEPDSDPWPEKVVRTPERAAAAAPAEPDPEPLRPMRIISVGPPPMHAPAEAPAPLVVTPSAEIVEALPIVEASVAIVAVDAASVPASVSLQIVRRRPADLVDARLVMLSDPDSPRSAGYRLLRDNMLAKGSPRLIAVTSGSANEGKTTCAVNLALALSEAPSKRVLLLEGSFSAPALGRIFHIDAATPAVPELDLPWLSPYRIVEITRGFHVGALVQRVGEPAPGFNSRWFDTVMGHLSDAGYDHLIIDTSALDGSSAVTRVVGIADGTLLTARSGGTTARALRRAAEQIPKGRALGITLIDAD